MIITFKRKDERSTDADKQDITREAVSSNVAFFTAADFSTSAHPVPSGIDPEALGYDVNRYDAPILMASLTDRDIAALKDHEDVVAVEEDGIMHALPTSDYTVEGVPEIKAQTVPAGVAQIKAPEGWGASQGLAIKVFILDTGIDSDHPDLVANLKAGKSFVPSESSTEDFNGHGTHCAGTVAAAFNGQGVVGVAPYAYLHPVKVLSGTGSGQWSWLIAAIDWVTEKKGPRILSMSLGGGGAPAALEQMVDSAYDDGCLLVAAAGNSGPGEDTVNQPATYDNVVAVSAIDGSDLIASFSSRGPEVELAGPGVNVLSTWKGGGYRPLNGTSMACPHVSGAAAMAWGAHRTINNKQVRKLLQMTADNLGPAGRDEEYGFGRVDAAQAAVWLWGIPEA
jgi:subtilisin